MTTEASTEFQDFYGGDTNRTLNGNEVDFRRLRNVSQAQSYPRLLYQPDPMIIVIFHFTYYCYPVVLVLGSFGNILAYHVFTRTRLRKVSSIQYLAAVAVTDTGFLWTFFLTPLYGFYKVPIIVQDGVCQFVTFLNYAFTFLSIWYLVAMVVEKFIGVYWPLKKPTMCTPFRAKLVMSFMAVICVACYSYVVYFFGPDKFRHQLQCMPWKELQLHFHNLSKIDTFVVALIPYIVIITLTCLIVGRGCEYYRISATVELWPRRTGSGGSVAQTSVRVTSILFPVVIFTVVGNLPVMILRTAMTLNVVQNPYLAKWNHLFYIFYIFNFGAKFYIYILFSRNFRRRTNGLLATAFGRLQNACRKYESGPQRINMESLSRDIHMNSPISESNI